MFLGPKREVFKFEIEGKRVIYFDKNWKDGIQIYPYPKKLVRKLLKSNKAALQAMGLLIHGANTGKDLKEYEACETEEDLFEIIKKDCIEKGYTLVL